MNDSPYGISVLSLELLKKTMAEFSEIERGVFFGSRAKGTEKRGSDIDIAIYGKDITPETALNLSATLNENKPLPYFVDVVSPKYLDQQDLMEHIESVGIIFYEREVATKSSPL